MKVNYNGEIIEATPEYMAELKQLDEQNSPPEPTPEERIAALEEQLKAAKILLGVN